MWVSCAHSSFNSTPPVEWYIATSQDVEFKMDINKYTCYNDFDYVLQNYQYKVHSEQKWENLYDHVTRKRVFTLDFLSPLHINYDYET